MSTTSFTKHPISRYLNIGSAEFPTFSSDGQRIAFLSDITGVPQVWQVAVGSNLKDVPWPEQLTFETDRILGAWFSPAQGDGRLIYARDVGGDENAQLFLLSNDGSADRPLTRGYEGVLHIFGGWSDDGSHILFAANRRDPGLFDLYLQPLDGEARLVWQNEEPGFLSEQRFSPDGSRVLLNRMASSFRYDLIEVDLISGESRLVTPSPEEAQYLDLCYAPDGRSVFLNTDLGSNFTQISRLNLDSLEIESIISTDWDTEILTLSPDGRFLAYKVNVDGASEVQLLDINSGSIRKAPGLEGVPGVAAMMEWHFDFSADGRRLAFSYTSATRTSDIYVWDLPSDQVYAVTRSSHGGLPVDSFVVPELVHYPTFDSDEPDGLPEIPAWFYRPKYTDGRPFPVIVFVHGGPEWQYKPYFHFLIQYFAQRGYGVLAPNVRGSTGYGKNYSHMDDVEKRLDSVADLAYAAYWLKQQDDVDGDRLVVYGGSYGGFMTLAAMTSYPQLWAAGVDVVGISNFVTFLENTSDYRRAHREAEYGSLQLDRELLERISPINNIDKITAPLMVIHGANDPRVPLGEAEQLVEALSRRGVPVEFMVFEDEGHGIAKRKNKLIAYPAVVDFLEQNLQR